MKFYIVDVFAEAAYQGNQLAVVILDHEISQGKMQNIAKEINFSETTFILSNDYRAHSYRVKIFTPDAEIPFAGHPTLGTAYIIRNYLEVHSPVQVTLRLNVGDIPVTFQNDIAWMTQHQPVFMQEIEPERIAATLGLSDDDIYPGAPVQNVSTGLPSIVTGVKDLETLKRCQLQPLKYQELLDELGPANLLVFTDEAEQHQNHLHSRVFMFTSGHLEDPATGSAHGNLASYLLNHQFYDKNHIAYRMEQGYATGRKSLLYVEASKDHQEYNIQIGGKMEITAEGYWY